MLALFLLFGLSGGVWIDVPFVKQDKNGCGSAVVWMVMKYWNTGEVLPVSEVHRELYSAEAGGVYARDMEQYLQQRGFRTFSFRAEWADLEQHLAQHRPLIVSLERNARGVPLHYVIVAGVDTERQLVWLNDPAQRKLVPMGRVEFEKSWMDNWTLLAVPEQSETEASRSSNVTVESQASQPVPAAHYGPEMEAATVAFREDRYSDARKYVASILRSNSSDAFASDFMATLYFLDDNLDAALKYWNRAGRPQVRDVRVDPPLHLNPVLLERVLAFSRANVLGSDEYRMTRAGLNETGIFSRYQLQLEPVDEGRFDVVVRANEKNGPSVLSWLRGVPYETVHPEFFNLGGRAINVRSLVRWDEARRRAWIGVSAPLARNPKWSYAVEFDARAEKWDATSFRKGELKIEVQSLVNDRWKARSGFAVSKRDLIGLKYLGGVERRLMQIPERRFIMDSSFSIEVGRVLEAPSSRFMKFESAAHAQWFPQARGDDYEVTARMRVGKAFGHPPFDELFTVGLDRDHDLWLRAHRATREQSYIVSNWDLQKKVYQGTFFGLSAGPFLDNGLISSESHSAWDTGLQLRLKISGGVTFNLSYGWDFRSGRGMAFTRANADLAADYAN